MLARFLAIKSEHRKSIPKKRIAKSPKAKATSVTVWPPSEAKDSCMALGKSKTRAGFGSGQGRRADLLEILEEIFREASYPGNYGKGGFKVSRRISEHHVRKSEH